MTEDRRTETRSDPTLTALQRAFLTTLLPGPRPTRDCQDAITVGGLLRLNFVAWDEPGPGRDRRRPRSTFALTEAGARALAERTPNGQEMVWRRG